MIENTKLTALVASRIFHDMVEPMSAIIQGLEMIKGADGKSIDPDALSLLDQAIAFAATGLDYFTTSEGATPALQRYLRQ